MREALTVAGAVVGAWFGNPQLGAMIGSMIGNWVDPMRVSGPRLSEIPALGTTEGAHRNVVYGTSWVGSLQVIDFGPVREVKDESREGKGTGPVQETFRYLRTIAYGVGEPAKRMLMLRRNGKIVYDVRPGSTILRESAKFAAKIRRHDGSEDQLPDAVLEALPHNGPGNTPAYRGTSYFVIVEEDVSDAVGSFPVYDGVFATEGTAIAAEPTVPVTLPESSDLGRAGVYAHISAIGDLSVMTQGWGPTVENGNGVDPGDPYIVWPGLETVGEAGEGDVIINAGDSAGDQRLWIVGANEEGWAVSFDGNVGLCKLLYRGRIRAYLRPTDAAEEGWWFDEDPPEFGGLVWFFGGSVYIGVRRSGGGGGTMWDRICRWPLAGLGLPVTALQTATNVSGDGSGLFRMHVDRLGAVWVLDALGNLKQYDSLLGPLATYPLPAPMTDGVVGFGIDGNVLATYVQNNAANEDQLVLWNLSSGTEISRHPLGDYQTRDYNHRVLFSDTSIVVQAGDQLWTLQYGGAVAGEATTARAVVEDVFDRCGIPVASTDMTAIPDPIDGITLGGPYDGMGTVSMLMPAYIFDLMSADGKVRAVKRGGPVVRVFTEADLVEEPDEGVLLGQGIEIPRRLQMKYYNPGQDYAAPAAVAFNPIPDDREKGDKSIDLPIAMNETTALNTVNRMYKIAREDRLGETTFAVPFRANADITPTDCVGIQLRGRLYRVRCEKASLEGSVLKLTGRRDRQSAATSNLTAMPLPPPSPPPPSLAGPTDVLFLNIPGVVNGDDRVGIRIAVAGRIGTAWRGARVDLSTDGRQTWTSLGIFDTPARMGRLLAPLPAAPADFPDNAHLLQVKLNSDRVLEAITDLQLLQERNGVALVSDDGTAEIVQYRDATDDGDRAWSLGYLLRGRLATPPTEHPVGRRVVVLDDTRFLPLEPTLIGRTLAFRVISIGTLPELAPVFEFNWSPAHCQLEFAPLLLSVARAGGVITASWYGRPRFGSDVNPIHSANFDGYRVTYTDGTTTEVVETDFTELSHSDSAFSGPVTVTVQALNRLTGPGPGISEVTP